MRPRSIDDVFEMEDPHGLLEVVPAARSTAGGDGEDMLLRQEIAFVAEHGRAPSRDAQDVVEAVLATRLHRLRATATVSAQEGKDANGSVMELSDVDAAPVVVRSWRDEDPEDEVGPSIDDILASELDLLGIDERVFELGNVTPASERTQPEHRGERRPCADFESFRTLFETLHHDVEQGRRSLVPFTKENRIETIEGDFFVERGLYAYVAEKSEKTLKGGRRDHRLRVVYSNGTESDVLMRSFERGLYNDNLARRVSRIGFGPLDPEWEDDRAAITGTVYIARSLSARPDLVRDRMILHKIGVTSGSVQRRVADAANDATFLLAPVEIVATYELKGMRREKVEHILHHFFDHVRARIIIRDRFGREVHPREWFYVQPDIVAQAIRAIADGTIVDLEFNVVEQALVKRAS